MAALANTSYKPDDLFSDTAKLSHDRLGFTFCLALALHAALILGISFNQQDRSLAPTKLEITLAQHRSGESPEKADFLAQNNQLGSGTLEEKAMLTTKRIADFQDTAITEVAQHQQQSRSAAQLAATPQLSTTTTSDHKARQQQREQQQDQLSEQQTNNMTIVQRSREIASLEAKLDIQSQAYAKRPRIRRLTSVATKQSIDAHYLHNWRSKIEAIGNQHYPSKAKQQQLFGELRLLVSLLPSGDVYQVKILESSGHKILDQAAIKIVHLAAPYPPFPRTMQQEVDVLEIIRTWRFQQNRLSSSS
jgi:protein TonB